MAYVSLPDFKAYVRNELAGTDDGFLQSCLDAATSAINSYCQRNFVPATGVTSARLYVPDGSTLLTIHDCVSVESILSASANVASSGWQLEPLNGITLDGDPRPYTQVRLVNGACWYVMIFNKATITVTADWGWPATPSAVVEATRILARDVAGQRDVRNGLAVFGDYAAVAVQNRMVKSVLDPLRRAESWGMA